MGVQPINHLFGSLVIRLYMKRTLRQVICIVTAALFLIISHKSTAQGPSSEADLKKEIWKHAVAGKMNISQMLAFFNMHFNRHRKQVYRTLAELVL